MSAGEQLVNRMPSLFKRAGRYLIERIAESTADRVASRQPDVETIAERTADRIASRQPVDKIAESTAERIRVYYENFSQTEQFTKSGFAYMSNHFFDPFLRNKTDRLAGADKGTQLLLALRYKELLNRGQALPSFDDVEFRCFSQNGEDGILLYIFSLIGTTNKMAVEICAGPGFECNTTNLVINHGWRGLLMDGNIMNIQVAREFFYRCQDTFLSPPTLAHCWVTADNVNTLIREYGFQGEIDLLSLDMDGIDYWVLKAMDSVQPRVIVLEYNASWGPDRSMSVPYKPDFAVNWMLVGDDLRRQYYFGASLAAFVKLGQQKGYRLVGCQRAGHNAFFVRNGIGDSVLPAVPPSQCFELPLVRHRTDLTEVWRDWPTDTADCEWVEV